MKKTILSFLLIGSAGLVIAQQQPVTSNPDRTKLNNNGNTNTNLNNTQPADPNGNYPPTSNVPPVNQPATNMNSNVDTTFMTDPDAQPFNNNLENRNAMTSATTTTYELNVPSSIQTTFRTSYPEVTVNSWYQSGDWYVARYVDNGQIKQVSYREDGKVLNAMMSPVKKSFVPDEIVSQAIQKYGANLYAIGSSKGADGQDMYNVTLIENGQSRTEWMNTDGSTADNHFRTEDEATMHENQQTMTVQQETEMVNQDSTPNQPVTSDTTRMSDQPGESQAEPLHESHPQEQEQDQRDNDANQEGINNASEINGSPKRSY